MPGRPNRGIRKGIKPAGSRDFVKGEKRTIEAAHKGVQARKEKLARFRTLREAAEALRDVQARDAKTFPNTSNGVALVMAQYEKAQSGDPKAASFIANILGEMTQKIEVSELPTIIDDVPRAPDVSPSEAS